MSAVLTGTSAINVSGLSDKPARRLYCNDCRLMWVQCPSCWRCYEPGVPFTGQPLQ